MHRFRAILALMAVLAVGVFVAGCGGDDDDSGSSDNGGGSNAELITDGTLTVGSDIPFPPFEQGRPPDYDGFDIDLINAIADNLGYDVKIEDTSFDTIFADLAQGRFDVVISASTITPDREKVVAFSDPYYEAEQALVVPEGSDIQSVEDLDGAIVGAQDGTTGETYANDETNAASVRGFPNGPAAIQAVKSGQVDATIIDQPVAQDAVDKGQTGFEVVTTIPTGELYGIAIGKDNTGLQDEINGALSELKDDGTLNDIYQKWFKIDAPESVLNSSSASQ